jgi:DNA-binding NtrC family response regulator
MERAVLWSRGGTIGVDHLSLTAPVEAASEAAGNGAPTLPPPGVDLGGWEKAMLERALAEAGGNQTRAAQRLGITRDTLRYRLKKHGLQG